MIGSIVDGLRLIIIVDLGCGGGWILKLKAYSRRMVGLDFLPMVSCCFAEESFVCGEIGKLL